MKIKLLEATEHDGAQLEPGVHEVSAMDGEALISRAHARPATNAEIAGEEQRLAQIETASARRKTESAANTGKRTARETAAV